MAEVDSLEIRIAASSTEAAKKVNDLAAALENVKKSLVGSGLDKVSEKIRAIGNAGQQIKLSVDPNSEKAVDSLTAKVTALRNAVEQVNQTAIKIPNVSQTDAAAPAKAGGNVQTAGDPVKIASALDKTDSRLEKTRQLVADLEKEYAALQKRQGKGSTNAQASTNAALAETSKKLQEQRSLYDQLLQKCEELSQLATGSQSLDAREEDVIQSQQVEETAKKVSILRRAFDSLNNSTFGSNLRKQFEEATSGAENFRKALGTNDTLFSAVGRGISAEVDSIKNKFAEAASENKKLSGTVLALKTAYNSLVSPIKKAASAVLDFAKKEIKSAGSSLASKFTKPFQSAISTVTKWKNAIGRIAFYRLIRGAIKAVTDGFSTGIKNLYEYSKLVGTQFAPAMDSLATSSLYLKNSLGALAAPLIQAVAPAVDYLIDKFVSLLNIIGKAMAALTGKTVYSQAKKQATEYEDAAKQASGAAKEFQRYLIGIDELNIITEPNSGGGGGAAAEDYGSMFEEVPVEGMDWAQQIKDAIEDGDWYGAGKLLAQKLNSVLDNFDAKNWGNKLGEMLDHGIQAAYGFMSTMDFTKIGSKLADLLNGAFEKVDFSTAGRLFVRTLTYLPDMIIGFLTELDWGLVAKSVSDFLTGAFDEATVWLNGHDWSSIGQTLWQNIKDAVNNIDFSSIATTFFTLLGTAIRSAAQFLISFFGSVAADIKAWWNADIAGEDWSDTAANLLSAIGQGFVDIGGWAVANIVNPFMNALLGEDTWQEMKDVGRDMIEGLWNGITEFLGNPLEWLRQNLVDPVVNGVKELLGIHSPSTVFEEIGGYIVEGLLLGISETWNTIVDFFSEKLEEVKQIVSTAWDDVKTTANTKWTEVKTTVGTVLDGIKTNASTALGTIKSTVSTAHESIKSNVQKAWESVKTNTLGALESVKSNASSAFTSMSTTVSQKANSMKANVSAAWINIKATVSAQLSSISTSVTNTFTGLVSKATTWGRDLVSNIASGINGAVGKVKTAASDLAGKIKEYIHFSEPDVGPLSDFHTYMPDMLATMAEGIRSNAGLVVNAVSDVAGQLSGAFSNMVYDAPKPRFSNLEDRQVNYRLAYAGGYEQNQSGNYADAAGGTNADVVNALFAVATQIVTAINNKDTSVDIDGERMARKMSSLQAQRDRMYRR